MFFAALAAFNTVVWVADRYWVNGFAAVLCAVGAALSYVEEWA
jgi:hypothetical protein